MNQNAGAHAARPAYLDYAATTPVDPRVASRMAQCLTHEGAFGNPGSLSHDYGDAASAAVEAARSEVAAAVGATAADVVFTSGATEANNLALFGVAGYYRAQGRHIVTVRTEHKAVLDPCRELERRGWRVTYLEPSDSGVLDPAQVGAALRSDTVLVSVMHVNNEIGVIQDIAAIAGVCAAHGTARLHVDGAQSVGKCAIDFAGWDIDLLSLSAHKAYGPKGVGALVVSRRRGVQLQALQFGGGQERNLRSGTVPTHQVVGMGTALALAAREWRDEVPRVAELRDRLWHGLEALGGVLRNGDAVRSVAQLLNVSFAAVDGESLLAGIRPFIAVSTGSACTSAVQEPSYVLRALGRDERLAESSLRFSLGRFSTAADVDAALAVLERVVLRLRRIGGSAAGVAAVPDCGASPETPAATGTSMRYNDLTWHHFRTAAGAGELAGPRVHRGAAGSLAQGTWVQFDLQFDPQGDSGAVEMLRTAKFRAYGCPHVIAVADWLTLQAAGREAVPALPESLASLQARFALPAEKRGKLLVIEDAWIAAMRAQPPANTA